MNEDRPPLASGALDRDAAARATPELLAAAWREPAARVLRMRGVEIPIIDGAPEGASAGNTTGLARLALHPTEGEAPTPGAAHAPGAVYLGRMAGAPMFAIDEPVPDHAAVDPAPDGERWVHPFSAAEQLPETERELLAVGSALLRWHESAGFSPRDGQPTDVIQGGWARRDARGAELFPRTDPAVIVLIEHEDRVLLGSNALWEAGRFSLLAGFVEAGESLEQTVEREVFEEAGVRLEQITYVTSQPWPFPRSLMLGFRARLAAGSDPADLTPDPEEISELRWFTREQLRTPEPGITLPGPVSIARWLIDRWVAEGDTGGH